MFRSFWDRDECFNLLRAFHEMYRTVVEPANASLDEYGTDVEHDERLLAGDSLSPNARLAVRQRASEKRILRANRRAVDTVLTALIRSLVP